MNLDLAIMNALRRGPMANAMHSVSSNYGQTFELHAHHQDVKKAEDLMGVKLGNNHNMPNFNQKNAGVIPWANGVHYADTLPSKPLTPSKRDNLGNKINYPFGNPIGQSYAAPVNMNGVSLIQRRKF